MAYDNSNPALALASALGSLLQAANGGTTVGDSTCHYTQPERSYSQSFIDTSGGSGLDSSGYSYLPGSGYQQTESLQQEGYDLGDGTNGDDRKRKYRFYHLVPARANKKLLMSLGKCWFSGCDRPKRGKWYCDTCYRFVHRRLFSFSQNKPHGHGGGMEGDRVVPAPEELPADFVAQRENQIREFSKKQVQVAPANAGHDHNASEGAVRTGGWNTRSMAYRQQQQQQQAQQQQQQQHADQGYGYGQAAAAHGGYQQYEHQQYDTACTAVDTSADSGYGTQHHHLADVASAAAACYTTTSSSSGGYGSGLTPPNNAHHHSYSHCQTAQEQSPPQQSTGYGAAQQSLLCGTALPANANGAMTPGLASTTACSTSVTPTPMAPTALYMQQQQALLSSGGQQANAGLLNPLLNPLLGPPLLPPVPLACPSSKARSSPLTNRPPTAGTVSSTPVPGATAAGGLGSHPPTLPQLLSGLQAVINSAAQQQQSQKLIPANHTAPLPVARQTSQQSPGSSLHQAPALPLPGGAAVSAAPVPPSLQLTAEEQRVTSQVEELVQRALAGSSAATGGAAAVTSDASGTVHASSSTRGHQGEGFTLMPVGDWTALVGRRGLASGAVSQTSAECGGQLLTNFAILGGRLFALVKGTHWPEQEGLGQTFELLTMSLSPKLFADLHANPASSCGAAAGGAGSCGSVHGHASSGCSEPTASPTSSLGHQQDAFGYDHQGQQHGQRQQYQQVRQLSAAGESTQASSGAASPERQGEGQDAGMGVPAVSVTRAQEQEDLSHLQMAPYNPNDHHLSVGGPHLTLPGLSPHLGHLGSPDAPRALMTHPHDHLGGDMTSCHMGLGRLGSLEGPGPFSALDGLGMAPTPGRHGLGGMGGHMGGGGGSFEGPGGLGGLFDHHGFPGDDHHLSLPPLGGMGGMGGMGYGGHQLSPMMGHLGGHLHDPHHHGPPHTPTMPHAHHLGSVNML